MSMKENKERRDVRRVPIRVLVNCLPTQKAAPIGKDPAHGWEMWAKNLGDDGVGLKWSLAWASDRCPHCLALEKNPQRIRRDAFCQCISPALSLKQGEEILLDGLVYDEKGSQPMKGLIQWVRHDTQGKSAEFGIYVTTPEHREYFRALEDA